MEEEERVKQLEEERRKRAAEGGEGESDGELQSLQIDDADTNIYGKVLFKQGIRGKVW